ncbi:hypothetical protein AB0B03_09895 [Micromonospora chalcea]
MVVLTGLDALGSRRRTPRYVSRRPCRSRMIVERLYRCASRRHIENALSSVARGRLDFSAAPPEHQWWREVSTAITGAATMRVVFSRQDVPAPGAATGCGFLGTAAGRESVPSDP